MLASLASHPLYDSLCSSQPLMECLAILDTSEHVGLRGDKVIIILTESVFNMETARDIFEAYHKVKPFTKADHTAHFHPQYRGGLFAVTLGKNKSLNPGIAMPVAFIRRFLTDKELGRCNEYLSNCCLSSLQDFIKAGTSVTNLKGIWNESSLIFMYIGLKTDLMLNFGNDGPDGIVMESKELPKDPSNFQVFKMARCAIEIAEKEILKIGGRLLNTALDHKALQISFKADRQPEVASYLCCRIKKELATNKVTDSFRAFVRFGDVNWRCGVNGNMVPYGHLVRSVAHFVQTMKKKDLSSGVYLHTDGCDLTGEHDYSMLTELKSLNKDIEDKDSEYDSDDDLRNEVNDEEKKERERKKKIRHLTKGDSQDIDREDSSSSSGESDDEGYNEEAEIANVVHKSTFFKLNNAAQAEDDSIIAANGSKPSNVKSSLRARSRETKRKQAVLAPGVSNSLHESILRNRELRTKWMTCKDILTPACNDVYTKSAIYGRAEVQNTVFRRMESLLLSSEATFTFLEAKGGYGKSSIADVALNLAKKVRITHVKIHTDESEMHDPWSIWKRVIVFLLSAGGLEDDTDEIDTLVDMLPLDESEKPRALLWLHDVVPEKHQANSPIKRKLGSIKKTLKQPQKGVERSRKTSTAAPKRRGSVYEALESKETLDLLAAEEKNLGAAGILTMKLELFDMFVRLLLKKVGAILLVIEDLQWMDVSSWKLLRRICTIEKGLTMICTTRPVSSNQVIDYNWIINKSTKGKKIVLQRLSPSDLLRMAMSIFPSKTISAEFHGRLVAVSKGFTFLAAELLLEARQNPAHSILLKGMDELTGLLQDTPSLSLTENVELVNTKRAKAGQNVFGAISSLGAITSFNANSPSPPSSKKPLNIMPSASDRSQKPGSLNKGRTIENFKSMKRKASIFVTSKLNQLQVNKIPTQNNKQMVLPEVNFLSNDGSEFRTTSNAKESKIAEETKHFLESNPESKLLKDTMDSMMIGKKSRDEGEGDINREIFNQLTVAAAREIEKSTKERTAAEKTQLNMYYEMAKGEEKSSAWEHLSSRSGCDYYIKNDTGNLRQAKSVTTVENATPNECLAFIIGTSHMVTSKKPSMLSGKKLSRINDHSEVIQVKYKFPPPCYNRDLVYMYTWKKLSNKDTIVMGMVSTDHEDSTKEKGTVRMQLKFGVYVLEASAGVGTKVSFFLCLDPKGYIAGNLINSQLMQFMSGPGEIKNFFSTNDDSGLPLLKKLLERRLVSLEKSKRLLLGYAAVMGGAIRSAKELIHAVKEEGKKPNARGGEGRTVVEITDVDMYEHFGELVIMGILDGEIVEETKGKDVTANKPILAKGKSFNPNNIKSEKRVSHQQRISEVITNGEDLQKLQR